MFPDDYSPLDPEGHPNELHAPDWMDHALLDGKISVRRHVRPFPGLHAVITTTWALVAELPGNVDVIIVTQRDKTKVDDAHRKVLAAQRELRRERKEKEEEKRNLARIQTELRAYVASLTPEAREKWHQERKKEHDKMRENFFENFNHDIGEYKPCL